MALELDLYTLLSTDASISAAMVLPQPNVWLGAVAQGAPDSPALVIQCLHPPEYLSGADKTNALIKKLIQLDSYHVQYSVALAISNAARDLLKDMRQVSLANTQVQGVLINDDRDMPQEPGAGGYVQRRLLQLEIWHTEGAGSVPFSPIQAPVAGSNAAYLEGFPISTTPPTDGQGLVYDATAGLWKPGIVSGGGSNNFADEEVPAGAINGTNGSDGNAVYTLAHSPLGTPILVKNGQVMTKGIAYNLVTNTITYLAPYIPVTGDTHAIWYRF